jgi:hypothetical protein
MKFDWNTVWFKVRIAPLDWWRFYAKWFRHAESAFLRVGPVELSMCWGLEEARTGCAASPSVTEQEKT